jgi:hypothetical protein
MSFWTESYADKGVNNPKRNFRFHVQFTEMGTLTKYGDSILYYAKTANKPSFTLGETTHSYLNHTFKFPGRVTWNDVTITMVDPGPATNSTAATENGLAYGLTKLLKQSGYVIPQAATNTSDFSTISKTKAVSGIGDVIITQLDHNGNELEKWTLYNAFLSDIKYGDLDYSSDDLTEYSITLRYDWAEYEGIAFDGLKS